MYNETVFDFLLGIPFVKGGHGLKGFDCWGLHYFCRHHVGLPALTFLEWIAHLSKRKDFIDALLKENEQGKGRFIKLKEPDDFCCALYKTKEAYHMGTVLPGGKKLMHIYRGITVLKQELSDIELPIMGFYNYA